MEYVKKLYKEACIEDCIGWLDPANNKAFLTSQISCTNNAYSIMSRPSATCLRWAR